jgi:hypothetical protein
MRRVHLRGRENILKHELVYLCGFNLELSGDLPQHGELSSTLSLSPPAGSESTPGFWLGTGAQIRRLQLQPRPGIIEIVYARTMSRLSTSAMPGACRHSLSFLSFRLRAHRALQDG